MTKVKSHDRLGKAVERKEQRQQRKRREERNGNCTSGMGSGMKVICKAEVLWLCILRKKHELPVIEWCLCVCVCRLQQLYHFVELRLTIFYIYGHALTLMSIT